MRLLCGLFAKWTGQPEAVEGGWLVIAFAVRYLTPLRLVLEQVTGT